MAEYKYRALGWQDDDIASLNVVDGTAADNQVELQITKQGAGTIDGPAIVAKDGITINKAADSEKIEISGSGLVQVNPITSGSFILYGQGYDGAIGKTRPQYVQYEISGNVANSIAQRRDNASLEAVFPDNPNDLTLTNKKYVENNYVKREKSTFGAQRVYGINPNGTDIIINLASEDPQATPGAVPQYKSVSYIGKIEPTGSIITATPQNDYQCANKKYVDDAIAGANPHNFKTLFGSQSIVGTGNIDLYRHHVKISTNSGTYSYEYYTDIISSQNFPIESITDLKTYLGDKFTKDIYGEGTEDADTTIGLYITQAAIKYLQAGSIHAHSISTATITDTVTTI